MSYLLDDQLLQDLMRHFYGYGNYGGDYWFVGMEEGGGRSKVIVFYGFGYLPYWQSIVGAELQPVDSAEIYARQEAGRLYVVLKHPATTGVTNEYFHAAGRTIRKFRVESGA